MIKKRRIIFIIQVILALIIVGAYVLPYLYLFFTSFKPPGDVLSIPPTMFPKRFDLQNYLHIFDYEYLPKTFMNSFIIALISTSLTLLISIPAAYAITRYKTRYSRVFLGIALVSRMIPYMSIALPLFFLMRTLKLVDTQIAVAVGHMTISFPLAIWLLASFFESLPFEIEEAARVDGCSRLGALLRVIIPISLGGIGVTAIFVFLASWNDFLFSLLLTGARTKTVTMAIAEFHTQYGTYWGTMASLSILYSLPVILVAFFFQKRLITGTTMGAVKG